MTSPAARARQTPADHGVQLSAVLRAAHAAVGTTDIVDASREGALCLLSATNLATGLPDTTEHREQLAKLAIQALDALRATQPERRSGLVDHQVYNDGAWRELGLTNEEIARERARLVSEQGSGTIGFLDITAVPMALALILNASIHVYACQARASASTAGRGGDKLMCVSKSKAVSADPDAPTYNVLLFRNHYWAMIRLQHFMPSTTARNANCKSMAILAGKQHALMKRPNDGNEACWLASILQGKPHTGPVPDAERLAAMAWDRAHPPSTNSDGARVVAMAKKLPPALYWAMREPTDSSESEAFSEKLNRMTANRLIMERGFGDSFAKFREAAIAVAARGPRYFDDPDPPPKRTAVPLPQPPRHPVGHAVSPSAAKPGSPGKASAKSPAAMRSPATQAKRGTSPAAGSQPVTTGSHAARTAGLPPTAPKLAAAAPPQPPAAPPQTTSVATAAAVAGAAGASASGTSSAPAAPPRKRVPFGRAGVGSAGVGPGGQTATIRRTTRSSASAAQQGGAEQTPGTAEAAGAAAPPPTRQ